MKQLELVWITVAAVAGLVPPELGLTEKRIYRLANDGVLPDGVVLRLGRRVFINWPAFQAWLLSGGAGFAGGWRKDPGATSGGRSAQQ
jgi:hypothetical protein